MRFETRVLKQHYFFNIHGERVLWHFLVAAGERPSSDRDRACTEAIVAAGWNVSRKHDGLVLVFSTKPVRGASTCTVGMLNFAGWAAMSRKDLHLPRDTKLWWWPEFVQSPKKRKR